MNMKFLTLSLFVMASCNAVPPETSAHSSAQNTGTSAPKQIILTANGASIDGVSDDIAAYVSGENLENNHAALEVSEAAIEASHNEFIISKEAQQGAIISARAPIGAVSVTLDGGNLPLSDDGFFLMGFDRDAGPNAQLVAVMADGSAVQKNINVAAGKWRLENINAPYRAGRSNLAFQRLRGPEIAQINTARQQNNISNGWRQDFIWPVKGRISGLFGAQRVYQGKPGSYHSGLDVAAATGTPYVAPADGVVILATQTPFTLEGNLLMIDHGNGLNSAFLHSSAIDVKVGDVVKQGQVIGRVGSTGRATGPHLHWGMKWNDARVDPLLLLPPQ